MFGCIAAYANNSGESITDKIQNRKQNSVNLLFLQQAKTAKLALMGNDCYQLTLDKLNTHVLYFSDQPERVVGHMHLKEFIEGWPHFKPNAAIHAQRLNKMPSNVNFVVSLNKPHYINKNSMSYTACALNPELVKQFDSQELGLVTLFIDPFNPFDP
jgi:hypothetical protein